MMVLNKKILLRLAILLDSYYDGVIHNDELSKSKYKNKYILKIFFKKANKLKIKIKGDMFSTVFCRCTLLCDDLCIIESINGKWVLLKEYKKFGFNPNL